jgi:hypothetical protein
MRRRSRGAAAGAVLAATATAALAVTGQLVDADGRPIADASVCRAELSFEQHCVSPDREGRFELPDRSGSDLRIVAKDHLAKVVEGVGDLGRIVLERAPVLSVRLVDASTGEAIAKGEVVVVVARDGENDERGPFPANAAGVKIQRLLPAGAVRVLGRAVGYRESEPQAVELVAGKESSIVLRLEPVPAPAGAGPKG